MSEEQKIDVVVQTAAVVAALLKPLIDKKICDVKRAENGNMMFSMNKGSAGIIVMVMPHPMIEDDAVVHILGTLATLDPDNLDVNVLVTALALNSKMNGYAIALDPDTGTLHLRGSLIGSTMDELEFRYLLMTLGEQADELDDQFVAAISGKPVGKKPAVEKPKDEKPQPPEDGKERTISDQLIELTKKIQPILDEAEQLLLQEFFKQIDEEEQAQLGKIVKDEELLGLVREIAFGRSSAGMVAMVVHPEVPDENRRAFADQLAETLPVKARVVLHLFAFAVARTSILIGQAMGIGQEEIERRLKVVFG